MGTNYAARALIGVKLPQSRLFRTRRVRAFEHDRPSTMKFDPDTGKELWRDESYCILMPDAQDEDYSCVEPHAKLGGLYLFYDRSGWNKRETSYLLGDAAIEHKHHSYRATKTDFARVDGPLIEDTRRRVEAVLAPHGLWNPERFGLWVAQYVAC